MGLRPSAAFSFAKELAGKRPCFHQRNRGRQTSWTGTSSEGKLGREERFRTVISGMEPRRIAVVMLLPRKMFSSGRGTKVLHDDASVNKGRSAASYRRADGRKLFAIGLTSCPGLTRRRIVAASVNDAQTVIARAPIPASRHQVVRCRRSSSQPPWLRSG
jgi:hypothetical protein